MYTFIQMQTYEMSLDTKKKNTGIIRSLYCPAKEERKAEYSSFLVNGLSQEM